jgi:hypothetical protein
MHACVSTRLPGATHAKEALECTHRSDEVALRFLDVVRVRQQQLGKRQLALSLDDGDLSAAGAQGQMTSDGLHPGPRARLVGDSSTPVEAYRGRSSARMDGSG